MPQKKSALERYQLGGTTFAVDPQAKLGAGAEGTVYTHPREPAQCVKLFHPPDPSDNKAVGLADYRSRKVASICGLGLALPPQFVLPSSPAYDLTGQRVVGFQMPKLPPDFHKLKRLLEGDFRRNQQIGLRLITELFADIFDDLEVVHGNGLVVGDVNMGCLMFQPGGERAWVDTDSWSYPNFPCLAVTEMFAHPDLYGYLTATGNRPPQQPRHDRFAFLLAFCVTAIPGAHPFRMGSHPTVQGIQHRTNAGLTIFDDEVEWPPLVSTPEVLSDELLDELVRRLKRQDESPLPARLLRAFAHDVTECKQCGAQYHASRRLCPQCQQVTTVQVTGLIRLLTRELFQAPGVLLFAQVADEHLYLVCRVGNTVQVIDLDSRGAATVLSPHLPSIPGARYRFFADCLAVAPSPNQAAPIELELYRVGGGSLTRLAATSTGVLEGEGAVFDASPRFLYRTAGNALLRSELFGPRGPLTDTQVAEVYQGQSWFTVDHSSGANHEVIFGYDRALRDWQWFVILGNEKGSRFQYHKVQDLGLRANETVEDFAVHFSAKSVLLVMQTSYRGRDYVRYAVIGHDGVVHLNEIVKSSDATYPYWENLRGKLHQGGSVLHVTAAGVVKQDLKTKDCTTFSETAGLVSADDRLVRFRGEIGIFRRSGVSTLSRK
jgi:hypothetical protein